MTDLDQYRRELRAGLAGVTPGPWRSTGGEVQNADVSDCDGWVATSSPADAPYIALCSPDRVAALLDAFDAAERERNDALDEAERERDEARAALAAYRADHGCTRGQHDGGTQFCAEAAQVMRELSEKDTVLRSAWLDRDLARADARNKTNIAVDLRRDVLRLDQECAEKDREIAELRRRIAVGSHPCPDWDGQIVSPHDPESECCTCKPEKE